MSASTILFDGVCTLCNASVNFIIRNDPEVKYKFAAFQSVAGQNITKKLKLDHQHPETLILIEKNKVFLRSTAALKIARNLKGIWPVFYVFMIIPKPIRDYVYNLVAKHRYSVFGQKKSCMIPEKEYENRFIDS